MIIENEEVSENRSKAAVEEAWKRTLEVLKKMNIAEGVYNEIKALKLSVREDGRIALEPRNSLNYYLLQKDYFKTIKEAFCSSLGYKADIYLKESHSEGKKTSFAPAQGETRKKKPIEDINLPLNEEYTFDSFVAGGNNRFALALAQAVAKEPGVKYNPLFIYGSAGLGKTHLMHAIGHEVYRNFPDAKVFFTSGEAFTTMYVDAAREGTLPSLKRKFRSIDLFLLDDVQFLLRTHSTVEEFFNLFNTLYGSKKQIVLTSDQSPKDLQFDERLISRFEQGGLADVKAPDLETRMAILQNKASREGMSFTLDVIEYVARLITGNVRTLTGALINLIAQSSLLKQAVTVDFAKSVLEDYYKSDTKKRVDPD
ncbi:MAG: ATP-binding protein, partial [Abditibacteriota bacterium]|nr:ATP-binding protein [Abditibacteriota bacterium]